MLSCVSYFGVWNAVAGKHRGWETGYSETGWLDRDIARLDFGYKGPLRYTVIRIIKLNSVELSP